MLSASALHGPRRAAVVGDPAAHSLSPAIHRAGYEANGLNWSYDACDVAPSELDAFVRARMEDPQWAGLSVTAPHKEAVMAYGEPDELTKLVGGGNTMVFGESPRIHNTDVPGFVRAWRETELPAPRSAAVLGNGATARSLVLALASLEVREVTLLVRDPQRASAVAELGGTLGLEVQVSILGSAIDAVDVVASTIPAAATTTWADDLVAAAQIVFDAVYDPWPTPLGEAASRHGRRMLSGLDLLAGQAVDQFFLLTGERVTFEGCRSAAGRELKRRSRL